MALWAKIDVGLRHHPKLIGRPDADFRLWVGLILHAKEHCPDFTVRDLSPSDMRGAFGIKAPVGVVVAGLKYFISKGMLVEQSDGGLLIRDMEDRQGKYDQEEQRDKWRDIKRKQRDKSAKSSMDNGGHFPSVLPLEEEVDPEKEISFRSRERSSTSVDVEKAPALVPEPWDAGILKKLQTALGLTDMDDVWGAFVGQSLQEPVEKRHAAAREFLRRGCAKEGKGWPYLLGMIKNGAGKHAEPKPVINTDPVSPERKAQVDRELAELRRGRG